MIALIAGVVGGLPLLLYPFVLLANMMSLAGHRSGDAPIPLMLAAYGFLLSSLAYPLVYGVCLLGLVPIWSAGPPPRIVALSLAPIGYLLLVAGLFGLWMALDQ